MSGQLSENKCSRTVSNSTTHAHTPHITHTHITHTHITHTHTPHIIYTHTVTCFTILTLTHFSPITHPHTFSTHHTPSHILHLSYTLTHSPPITHPHTFSTHHTPSHILHLSYTLTQHEERSRELAAKVTQTGSLQRKKTELASLAQAPHLFTQINHLDHTFPEPCEVSHHHGYCHYVTTAITSLRSTCFCTTRMGVVNSVNGSMLAVS